MPQRMRRSLPGVWLVGIALTLLLPAAASAEVARPAAPSGMRVVAATASSFTVAVRPTAHAHAYRLYASTVRSDLYARNISRAVASKVSTAPRMTVSGLTDRSAPYFYRVVALHRHRLHYSETIGEEGLRPDPPTALTVFTRPPKPIST